MTQPPAASKLPLHRVMKSWLVEDAPKGDITSLAIFGSKAPRAHAEIVARQALVVSGMEIVLQLLRHEFPRLRYNRVIKNGKRVKKGATLMRLAGPITAILLFERIALNILQHLSGIATLTADFVKEVRGTGTAILDTRKTWPGWRDAEKHAVRDGGGNNHRRDLADAYMIKDNHISAIGSAAEALSRVLAYSIRRDGTAIGRRLVLIEITRPSQMAEVLALKPDVIVLDNMTPAQIRCCVALRGAAARPLLEISGGVTLANVRQLAKLGVERISVGTLTHSAPAVDMALEITRQKTRRGN